MNAAKWDDALEKALCLQRKSRSHNEEINNRLFPRPLFDKVKTPERHRFFEICGVEPPGLPCYLPICNSDSSQWFCIIDLDREVFTIDHGAHFKVDSIPECEWGKALVQDRCGNRLALPGLVPEDSLASLDIGLLLPNAVLLELYQRHNVKIVIPKGIQGFDPARRHGPILCARIFQMFQRTHKCPLAHLLQSWKLEELHFREIVYAILCLASGSQNVTLELSGHLERDVGATHSFLNSSESWDTELEFVAHLGTGCHIEGNPPGSAPEASMYWFEGALVYLAMRVDNPETAKQTIAKVVTFCRGSCPERPVNFVLMSTQHIILA